ncbi:MAG: hypothetical protein ACYCZX_05670 [Rhodospirillaceae bacterium]
MLLLSALLSGCALQSNPTTAYDGHWTADIPVQGRCPAAHWAFDVKDGDIAGTATNPAGRFAMSGTLNKSGKGTIKINQLAGTIQFSVNNFESDYSNTCGARHASGSRAR